MLITLTLLPSLRLQSASNMPFLQPHLTFNRCSVDQDLSQSLVRCIWQPRQGFIRFGTEGGLNQDNGYSFEHFQHDPQNPNSLTHNHILTINEDRAGMLWIGAWGGGLNRCDPATEQFTRHRHDPDDHQSLSANEVITIHLNRRGTLWVGTGTAGLNKFDHATGTLTHCREKDGLPNDVVCGIRADEHGKLWMSTNQGIAKFNSTTGQFRNYDGSDGLQSDEFKVGACFKGKGGETFSGGINGLNAFHPPALRDNPPAPPVLITDFQLFNKSVALGHNADGRAVLPKAVTATDAIKLSYKDEVFSLGCVALNYASSAKNQYQHKMKDSTPIGLQPERAVLPLAPIWIRANTLSESKAPTMMAIGMSGAPRSRSSSPSLLANLVISCQRARCDFAARLHLISPQHSSHLFAGWNWSRA